MTGLTALDVVIGLAFIYSLYSLLASLIQEIIATNLSFRAKVLEKAIVRMLENERNDQWAITSRIKNLAGLLSRSSQVANGTLADDFYKQPLIKYLGEDKWHRKPAYLEASNFSKALLDVLKGPGFKAGDDVRKAIETYLSSRPSPPPGTKDDTIDHLNSLWADAQGDMERFRELLEKWFDDTMLRATEWYKKYNQVFLLIIGLLIAVFFNVDTVQIVRKLSHDPDLRLQLVQRADAYLKDHPNVLENARQQKARIDRQLEMKKKATGADSTQAEREKRRIDSLAKVYEADMQRLQKEADTLIKGDLKDVSELLALGWGRQCEKKTPCANCRFLPNGLSWCSPLGWLLTALALSLGAPFWFDLLNKLMKLRGAVQPPPGPPTTGGSAGSEQPRIKRVG